MTSKIPLNPKKFGGSISPWLIHHHQYLGLKPFLYKWSTTSSGLNILPDLHFLPSVSYLGKVQSY